jgi:sugar phosphate isomerase/epimerase
MQTSIGMFHGSLKWNAEYFKPILEWIETTNMRLAIENTCDFQFAPKRKFGSYPEELMELLRELDSSKVGICWDFDHGERMDQDHSECLRYIGSSLFATHVCDTHSKTDRRYVHVLSMTSTLKWEPIMKTLAEIGYNGDFCYEVHNYINRLPDRAVPAAVTLAYEVGEYLMDCYRKEVAHE